MYTIQDYEKAVLYGKLNAIKVVRFKNKNKFLQITLFMKRENRFIRCYTKENRYFLVYYKHNRSNSSKKSK